MTTDTETDQGLDLVVSMMVKALDPFVSMMEKSHIRQKKIIVFPDFHTDVKFNLTLVTDTNFPSIKKFKEHSHSCTLFYKHSHPYPTYHKRIHHRFES